MYLTARPMGGGALPPRLVAEVEGHVKELLPCDFVSLGEAGLEPVTHTGLNRRVVVPTM